MADGFEANRSEEYFYGGMTPRPVPRRLKAIKGHATSTQVPDDEKKASAYENAPEEER